MQVIPRAASMRRIIETTACPYCGAPRGENCTRPALFGGPPPGRDQPMRTVHDERRADARA